MRSKALRVIRDIRAKLLLLGVVLTITVLPGESFCKMYCVLNSNELRF